jgi:hypothetical protein
MAMCSDGSRNLQEEKLKKDLGPALPASMIPSLFELYQGRYCCSMSFL